MDINTLLEKTAELNMAYTVRQRMESAVMLSLVRTELEKFFEARKDDGNDLSLEVDGRNLVLRNPTPDQKRDFLLAFGGNWKREIDEYQDNRLQYTQERPWPFPTEWTKTFRVRIRDCKPPPSCKIVTEEVVVPEHKEKRHKVVCGDNSDIEPAPVAEEVQP